MYIFTYMYTTVFAGQLSMTQKFTGTWDAVDSDQIHWFSSMKSGCTRTHFLRHGVKPLNMSLHSRWPPAICTGTRPHVHMHFQLCTCTYVDQAKEIKEELHIRAAGAWETM